ncbi:hypothetical protein F974_00959 [Acinetobacter sp. CIP 102159]|uniref:hypothetical protein n=1 Tax=Acinetobacter sp. CIP 102159 TaxID=1144667 RepID=UPI0002CFEB50|nr:hypothetical protein [Acinetobacter sp. CIP 102159]ENU83974.1 hypothetical protein F974_00959 [Acinetobacter sp. CIP 102159]
MNFIDDFERTENSDYLHGVIGRCLIVATRFDAMCTTLADAIKYKELFVNNDSDFENFVNKISTKYSNLNNSIQGLPIDKNFKVILHEAREARNEIAHSLTKGLIGCIDNVDNKLFFDKVSSLIYYIAKADFIISKLTSIFNGEPILNQYFQENYCQKNVFWVVEK